jgi:hypothetical protein
MIQQALRPRGISHTNSETAFAGILTIGSCFGCPRPACRATSGRPEIQTKQLQAPGAVKLRLQISRRHWKPFRASRSYLVRSERIGRGVYFAGVKKRSHVTRKLHTLFVPLIRHQSWQMAHRSQVPRIRAHRCRRRPYLRRNRRDGRGWHRNSQLDKWHQRKHRSLVPQRLYSGALC